MSCSPSSIDTASSPVLDTTPAIVPNVSPLIYACTVSTNTLPMLTRSKNGIFKPKAYVVQANYAVTEPLLMLWPPSFLIGLKQWTRNSLAFNNSIPSLLFLYLMARIWLAVNGFLRSRGIALAILLGIKQG